MRIFRKTAIREASFLQTLSACALKESALSIFRPKSETQSTFAKAFRLVPKITNASCWILGANLFPVTVRTLVLDSLRGKRELIRHGPLLDFPEGGLE